MNHFSPIYRTIPQGAIERILSAIYAGRNETDLENLQSPIAQIFGGIFDGKNSTSDDIA
jgi:hypothetical protein